MARRVAGLKRTQRRGRRGKAGSRRRRWLRITLWLVAAFLAVTWLPVLALRFVPPPTTAFMLAAPGAVEYRWTPWAEISPWVPLAMMAAEDQRFPAHTGFDLEAIRSALAQAESRSRLRGASTISQQTAKNLFLWNGRSFVRKGLEAWFTVLIELSWPKQRILEVYVNIAELGAGIYGVGAASGRFFGKPPAALDAHEAALLAAVLPNPREREVTRPSPLVRQRAAWIERQMRQLGGTGYLATLEP